jgi:hypothetical protein
VTSAIFYLSLSFSIRRKLDGSKNLAKFEDF